ncbi:MAG: HPF/RaiA family ribosome-associated protein [Ferruginibacter sp.]|nr:HPF/RaiA family ribosome-associated protein [Ferruginibacter sp.]
MNISIQSVNFKAGATLEYFIAEKVSKLFKQGDNIIRAEVTLRQGDTGNPQNKLCDIRLVVPGKDHFVSKTTDLYEKSVLESVKTMQKILRSSKPARMLQKMTNRFYKVFAR